MRLVDADALIKKFKELKGSDSLANMFITDVMNEIKKQPTTYDVDKVVRELLSESDRWKESGEAYEDEKELGVADGFKRAIEIVKSGGISKE